MSSQGLALLHSALGLACPDAAELQSLFSRDKEDLLPLLDWMCGLNPAEKLSDQHIKRCVPGVSGF